MRKAAEGAAAGKSVHATIAGVTVYGPSPGFVRGGAIADNVVTCAKLDVEDSKRAARSAVVVRTMASPFTR